MKLLGKVTAAYMIASMASIITAIVLGLLWQEFSGSRQNLFVWIAGIWLVIVGVPSLIAASNYLLKLLGVKHLPMLGVASSRTIPVGLNADFAYSVPTVLSPNPGSRGEVDIKELEIREGDYIIGHQVLFSFLREAWRLQRQSKDGLSRNWWVENGKRLERKEYDILVGVLLRYGLITGRCPGRSGKLVMPPLSSIEVLSEKL